MILQSEKTRILTIIVFATMFAATFSVNGQTNEEKLATADRLYEEAVYLQDQGTAETLRLARDKYRQAAELNGQGGNAEGQGLILFLTGLASYKLGEKSAALDEYLLSLRLLRSVGNNSVEGVLLNNIGNIYDNLGDRRQALKYFDEALVIRRSIGDKRGEAITLSNIGLVYDALGDKQQALKYYNESLPLARAADNKAGEAITLGNIGKIYSDLGDAQKALKYYDDSLKLARSVSHKLQEATTLNNIGRVYENLNDKKQALSYYQDALKIVSDIGDKKGESITLSNIGVIILNAGDYRKALEYFEKSLEISQNIEDKAQEAITLNNIGKAYEELGEIQKALEYLVKSLPLFRAVENKAGEATILDNIGEFYTNAGEYRQALDIFYQSLVLSRTVGNKEQEAQTLGKIMFIRQKLKQPRLTALYGKQSVNAYQQIRANTQELSKELRQSYLKLIEENYRDLAEILIAENRLPEALQVLNSFKDQQFFDFTQSQAKLTTPLLLTPREKEYVSGYEKSSGRVGELGIELEELKRKIGSRQPTAEENAKIRKLETNLETASDDFLSFIKQGEAEFSEKPNEKDKIGEIPDLIKMQTALRDLKTQTGEKAVVVYQLVGEENFSALLISPDNIEKITTSVKASELNEKAKKLWGLLQTDRFDPTKLSKEIYDAVFKSLEAKLPKDTRTIMWSLDGNLRYLPMAALFDGEKYLVERFQNVVFTRADAERMTRPVSLIWSGTGFGTSRARTVSLAGDSISFNALPGVKEELDRIFKTDGGESGILKGEVLPDEKFTKENMLAALKVQRPLVHIASHFAFRPGDEANSFLLMGDGTAFTLGDMKAQTDMFAGVELLTLSACNTAAQQADASGNEVDGFAELAQRLGAGAVMATLWQVSDASTPWLMRDFYLNRQTTEGATKAEALRRAQLALLNGNDETKPLSFTEKGKSSENVNIKIVPEGEKRADPMTRSGIVVIQKTDATAFTKDEKKPFAHPYFWSPFILIGNWR